jgi:signal transduction histidine kinase/DNA-binding response OmpR family regulator
MGTLKNNLLLSFIFLFFSSLGIAQNDYQAILDTAKVGSNEYFEAYFDLAWELKDSDGNIDFDSLCTEFINQTLAYQQPFYEAKGMYLKAHWLGKTYQYDEAIDLFQKALDICEREGHPEFMAKILSSKGLFTAYASSGNFIEGIPALLQSNLICEANNFQDQLSNNYFYLGYLYTSTYQAQSEDPEILKTPTFRGYLIQAEQAFDKGLKIAEENGNQSQIDKILSQKVNLFLNQENYPKTIEVAQRLLKGAKQTTDKSSIYNLHIVLAKGYFGMNQREIAYNHMDTAILLINEVGDAVDLVYAYYTKYELALKEGDYKSALEFIQKKDALKDSLWTEEKELAFDEISVKYESEKKEKENLLLKNERSILTIRNRWISTTALISVSALLGLGFLFYRNNKQNLLIKKQKEELEKLDEVKTRFFANVTHELRTPLTLITGPLKQLMKNDELDEKTLLKISAIAENGEQLKSLVEELLDLNRYDANQLKLNKKPIHFFSFIQTIVTRFDLEAKDRGIDFKINYLLPLDFCLNLDANKLEKIISNLLSNAFKFTQRNGVINIMISESNNQIYIEVKDSGKGIHPDDLPHIFNRYFQTNQSDTPLQGGLGIGLAMAKELTQLMNGQLSVNSNLGHGSNFTLTFPKEISIQDHIYANTPKSLESNRVVAPESSTIFDQNILIVDDNPDMLCFIQELLESEANTFVAKNGYEALGLLEKHDIHLIITDLMMPEMDGITLLENLKKSEKWQLIPTIMLSARTDMAIKLKALTIGIDDYLTKPFEPEELIARVNSLRQNVKLRKEANPILGQFIDTTHVEIESANIKWLKKLEQIATDDLMENNLNTAQLAQKMAISERQLSRNLKKLTGLTPGAYLKEIQLQKARLLLENQAYSTVSEISYIVGFNTPQYFSSIYKERFGKFPSEYLMPTG